MIDVVNGKRLRQVGNVPIQSSGYRVPLTTTREGPDVKFFLNAQCLHVPKYSYNAQHGKTIHLPQINYLTFNIFLKKGDKINLFFFYKRK